MSDQDGVIRIPQYRTFRITIRLLGVFKTKQWVAQTVRPEVYRGALLESMLFGGFFYSVRFKEIPDGS